MLGNKESHFFCTIYLVQLLFVAQSKIFRIHTTVALSSTSVPQISSDSLVGSKKQINWLNWTNTDYQARQIKSNVSKNSSKSPQFLSKCNANDFLTSTQQFLKKLTLFNLSAAETNVWSINMIDSRAIHLNLSSSATSLNYSCHQQPKVSFEPKIHLTNIRMKRCN